MIPFEIALIVFACVFGGALLGMLLHSVVLQHHLTEKSKDVIKLGMGLIATMAALVLGLLISTAKSSYDTEDDAAKRSAWLYQCRNKPFRSGIYTYCALFATW
jgi:flagellar biosynthesis component FlhA